MSQPTFSRGELQVLKAWKKLQALLIEHPTWSDYLVGHSIRWDQMGRDILWLDLPWRVGSMVSMISALRLNPRTLRIEAKVRFGLGGGNWQGLGGHKSTLAVLKEITDLLEQGKLSPSV